MYRAIGCKCLSVLRPAVTPHSDAATRRRVNDRRASGCGRLERALAATWQGSYWTETGDGGRMVLVSEAFVCACVFVCLFACLDVCMSMCKESKVRGSTTDYALSYLDFQCMQLSHIFPRGLFL